MRVLLLALVAALVLAGAAAAGGSRGGGGRGILSAFRAGRTSRELLQTSEAGGLTVTQVTSGASAIKLVILQRKDPLPRKYYLVTYNNGTGQWVRNTVPWTSLNTVEQLNTPNSTFNTYEVTLSSVPVGYHRVRVDVTANVGGTLVDVDQGTFPSSGGAAVGTPGDVTVNSVTPVAGDKLQVTFTIGNPVTAGKYRHKVYPFGTADHSSITPSAFVDITPWTTATYTFTTSTQSAGLYSVWVEVQHKDAPALTKTTDTGATSYAIGVPAKPTIVRVEEPTSTNHKFKVFFTLPQKNVQEVGYTLTNTATGLDRAPTCSPACQTIGGTKYKASVVSVTGDPDGAEYSLETDSAPANALYRIKLWAFNDVDRATGTQSDPSKPVATYDSPGVPNKPTVAETAANSKVLAVSFSRPATAFASSYRYDVKDANDGFAQYTQGGQAVSMQNLVPSIADVTLTSLQFDTPAITSANQRYRVVLRACTNKDCSAGIDSDLTGVGQPAAPQAVQIASAGEDKLTVTWNAPTTDNTVSSYAVRLYSSTAAFAGAQAANWTGLAWDNQPPPSQGSLTIPGGGQNGYSFTTPPLTLPLGFYKAEVLAVSSLYSAQPANSDSDQAPLGYPGLIAIKAVALTGGLSNPARVTFNESEPKTASFYAITVQRRETDSTWSNVASLTKYSITPTPRGDGDKDITLSTRSAPWPVGVAGQYRFIVHAGNEASGTGVYARDSVASSPVLVGPPGNPSATAPDAVGPQLNIAITRGTPNLNEDFHVRIFKVVGNTWPIDCSTATQVDTTPDSSSTSVTTTALSDTMAIYCLQAVAVFEGSPYSSTAKSAPVFVGTPADPNTPTLTSGKTSLSVSFNCPTGVWNSRFMTYELKRVDMGRSNVVVNADPSATTNVSPKLVRGTAAAGEIKINENTGVCSFSIPSNDPNAVPNAADANSNLGQYKIRLQAHNNAASSDFSVESTVEATLGEPEPPTGVRVTNSATTDNKITIEMDKPNADVHGGFVLRLVWRSGKLNVDVASTTSADGVNLYIDRNDATNVNAPSDGKWTISFPIANMECGGASCNGKGRFKVVAFGALSRFDGNGNAVTSYKSGAEKLAATVPLEDIFYGNPGQPQNLAILNQPVRIYGPSATNTLNLQFDVPDADVAAGYQYELYYFKSQGDTSDAVVVTDQAAWSDLDTATTNKFTLNIDLTKRDCNRVQAGVQECTSGSYQLKSFKAITRVTTGGQDSSAATLPAQNDIIIVAAAGSTPEAPKNVHVPDVKLAGTPGDTQVYIEVDLPTTDNIMGWVYNLQYIPYGDTAQAVAVTVGVSEDIFTQRSCNSGCATRDGSRLKIPLPLLGQLSCGDYTTTCASAGGRFKLTALQALSWFGTANSNAAVQWNDAGRTAAVRSDGLTATSYKAGKYGSPRSTADSTWNANFYVGSPAANPSNVAVQNVQLSSIDLKITLDAPVADLAYSYIVVVKRIRANEAEDPKTITVTHDNRAPAATKKFELTIAPSELAGAGRYKLVSVAAVSWFDAAGALDRKTADNLDLTFIYGSPSEVNNFISGVNVPLERTGPTVKVQIDPPVADVASYYSVEVDYYSGKAASPRGLQLAVEAIATCTTTAKEALQSRVKDVAAGATLVVRCPAQACTTGAVYTSQANVYLFTSSICTAAVHANIAGRTVKLTLRAGTALPRNWGGTANVVTPADPGIVAEADNWDIELEATTDPLNPATTKFIVLRSAATLNSGNTKLELPINLPLANCRDTGTAAERQCGRGKYLVKSVTAHPWSGSGTSAVGAMYSFFFVGDPEQPTNVEGVSSSADTDTAVKIRFDRPEFDNAAKYTFVLTKYFPGDDAVTQTCSGEFPMPDATTATVVPGVDTTDTTKRTITVDLANLTPSTTGPGVTNGCASLRGKFRVTTLTATSRHTGGTDGIFNQADNSVNSYFYLGALGAITQVTPSNQATSPAATLTVNWRPNSADAHPAQSASYSLWRYRTGDTDTTRLDVCTGANSMTIDATQMDGVTVQGDDLQLTNVGFCTRTGVTTLDSGRYKINWVVQGWTATGAQLTTNQQSKLSEFFYVGTPTAPGKPALTNELANAQATPPTPKRLKVSFTTPATDNAEKYTYDLVKLDNPLVTVPADISSPAGYTVEAQDQELPDQSAGTILGAANGATNPTLNTFYITGLADGLYRVRVRSKNPNDNDALSAWSDVIGTGNPVAPVITSDVSDNVASGTTLNVKLDKPNLDVALYYTVDVDYYSGQRTGGTSLTTTGTAADVDQSLTCATTGQAALQTAQVTAAEGASLAVYCPASCDTDANNDRPVYTSATQKYLFSSSVCRAAIHAGVISATGGTFRLTLSTGATTGRTWSTTAANGVTPANQLTDGSPITLAADTAWDMSFAALPDTTTFTVMRWGGTNRVVKEEGGKLVLPIDLSKSSKCGATQNSQCGNGKYVVKQVKAFRWVNGGSFVSTGSGVPLATDRTAFTFVGNPSAPENVAGVSADNSGSSVQIRLDLPEQDNAQAYAVEIKKYFPGETTVLATCTKTFNMPTSTTEAAALTTLSDSTATTRRTITFSNLDGTGCSTLRGKFKVTKLTAVSWHGAANNRDSTTLSSAFFYIGPVGTISTVSSPNVKIEAATPSTTTSLVVNWQHTNGEDGHATKQAKYTLTRFPNGDDTTGVAVCANTAVDEAAMGNTAFKSGSTTELQLSLGVCTAPTALAKGRYKLGWTVESGRPTSSTASLTSASFFYIGDPTAPGKLDLTNDVANTRLKVTFTTPTADNAEKFTYDLVKLDKPSVQPPATAETSDTTAGYTFVSGHQDQDLPSLDRILGADNGANPTLNTFYITGLTDGLYRVRVRSNNPNAADALSAWSEPIGTGDISGKKPSSVTVTDGETTLTVTFKLVDGALGYQYTVYPGASLTTGATGHTNQAVTVGSWNIAEQTAAFAINSDGNLPKGRYVVAVRPTNTKLDGATSSAVQGAYENSAMAAMGTPGQPSVTGLDNPLSGTTREKKSLQVTIGTPSPDSALEYYYALFRDDTDAGCYVTDGQAVPEAETADVRLPNGNLVSAGTKTFVVQNLDAGDYKVRVGVKNGLTSSTEAITLCKGSTAVQLTTDVRWGALNTDFVSVDNPGKPGTPSVVYNPNGNQLTVKFSAPNMTRTYTYQVTKSDGSIHVPVGTPEDFAAANPTKPETFTISTSGWGPDRYQVTVYVQNAFTTGNGDASDASTGVYIGTPGQVSAVKLENKAGAGDTITVKYTPPTGLDIAGEANSTGSYRYTVQKREVDGSNNFVFTDLTGKVDQDAGKPGCSGATKECSFDISGLTAGMYQVKVWGRMTYPKTGGGDDVATGTPISSSGDHSTFMRSGQVAVGAPGVPAVALTGAADRMTITISSINGNETALSYQWVFLKDADTARTDVDTTGLPGIDIPVSGTGSVDPLAAPLSKAPVTYTVNLDSTYTAGTYRVGVIAVNGAGTSNYQLTTVNRATSIMGPPSTPVVSYFVVKDNTMDELVVTWNMPNIWTANPSATPSYTYTITNALSGSTDTYTGNVNVPSASGTDQTFTQKVTPTISGSGLYKVVVTARNTNGDSSNTAFPSTGLVVGVPIASSPDGLRDVSASRIANTKTLSINFKDNLNSWAGSAGSCETFYEWEVVQWPGLELAAASSTSETVHPCGGTICSSTTRECNGVVADVSSLADGRYQVFILAYNKYGYTRSEGSNVFTVGAPSANPLSITARDGDGKITVSFATPDRPGSYQCQGTGADGTVWTPATVTKQLSQVSLSSDGKTTSFDITSTDVLALATTKQRWAVQCKPINDWTNAVGYSALAYAASGAPVAVGAPTLALAGSTVTFTFAPATPDAAITYVFILEDQNGTVYESPAVGFASLAAGAGTGNKAYTWANAPSGQFKGKVRGINGVGSATSPESAADLVVGRPGTPGTPTALSGQTGFVVSFSPGSPSAATAFYYTIYPVGSETPVAGGEKLLADPATATGATVPTTPSGSTDYRGLTPFDRLQFNTGNLALKPGLTLAAGVYQIAVRACNDKLPVGSQCSDASAKSTIVSRGSPGIPTGLAISTGSQGGLKVEFNVPSPDAASFYEYTVRDAANNVSVTGATRVRLERPSPSSGKLAFNTIALSDYKSYQLRVTAVGAGSVFSSWSGSAVAGMLGKPTAVSVAPGADKLTVTFTAGALLLNTDTFAYKLNSLGATPQPVGDASGYLVPRTSITGDLAAAGQKSFNIALGAAVGQLTAPAGGYYVEVMAARPLTNGFEAGTASDRAGPAALGAPSTPGAAPTVSSVTTGADPTASIQWAYTDTYSTYTSVAWRIRTSIGSTLVASGSIPRADPITAAVSSPLSGTIDLKYTTGASLGQPLQGRFTLQVCMANAQVPCDASKDERWSDPSAVFAAGTPTAPATVTVSGSATALEGTFTLPPNAVYDTLSYRLVSVGQDGTGTDLLFGASGWKELTSAEIDAKTITITDSVVVGSTSFPVPMGRYRLDMRATANGASSSETSSTASAYKGTPAAATAVTATSGATSIQISFNGAAFATGYKVHVLDSNGAAVQSGGTDVISTLNGISGSGSHSYSLQLVELGSPSGAATFRFKVESTNPNTAGTGLLSSATSTPVIFGKLAKPVTPVLEWVAATASTTAYMELRFQEVTPPAGAEPTVYEYQLTNATSGTAIGGWQAIDMSQTTGAGSSAQDPYKFQLFPSPGRYTAKVRAGTALSATATSDESSASQPEVMGLTSQPSIAAIGSGDSNIDTADDGATTIKLLVTLPSNNLNSGDSAPQLQLRMDTMEPSAAQGQGTWTDVGATCPGATEFCVESGKGSTAEPLVVKVTLSAAVLSTPRRVSFVARTVNDNGAGAESSPSNTISVGHPGAPTVTATGSASGVDVTFTPATLLTGDTFRVWAVDASAGGSGERRLVERDVTTVTTAQGGQRTFFVPFVDFEGNNIPYIVTLKMVAVNANNKRSQDGSASASVTVGSAIAPTAVTATPALSGSTATVALSWQHGDTTVIQYDIKATSATRAVMTFAFRDGTKLGHILTVGGGAGQLPPGRWTFTVVAHNAVSQAESEATGEVAAGTPGVPVITGVTGTDAGTATITFVTAADNVADQVRVSFTDGVVSGTLATPFPVPTSGPKAITVAIGTDTNTQLPRSGNWRIQLESGNAGTGAWSAASSAWPATTVGLPGKPTIVSATGSKDTITLVVEQAADATATAFELEVYDADGAAVTPAYNASLLSVSGRNGNGRQSVVFGTDNTKLGGTYRFKVAAINSLGKGTTASDMTTQAQAVAAYMPDKPTGLKATGRGDKAVLAFTPPAGAVSYEAAILVATGDTWAVTAASSLAPYAPTAVTVSGTQRQFDVPLSALANLDGRYKFQVRALDANGVRGEWSTESGAVTVGVPDAPRNLVSTAVLDTTMADSANSNVTLSFVPAWLAEQGYVVEVLDADGNKLDEVELAATTCTAKATAPV